MTKSDVIDIQVKAPYTALSRSGLKIRFGEPITVDADDGRVQWWLENGYVEEVPKKTKKSKRGEKEL